MPSLTAAKIRRRERSSRQWRRSRGSVKSRSSSNDRSENALAKGTDNVEIIDLGDDWDSDGAVVLSPSPRGWGRKRPHSSMGGSTGSSEVEILSPPRAAAVARAQSWVDRIREVFPLISRAKVEGYLTMAQNYLVKDEEDGNNEAFYSVMTVLSEDPLGANVTESSFAAAAVSAPGGSHWEGQRSPTEMAAASSSRKGQRKVAQLECQCCFANCDYEDMVSCRDGGHLFCRECLQRHTEQRVFGAGNLGVKQGRNASGKRLPSSSKALEILCMAPDCDSGFHERQLRRACSDKVMGRYNELQYAAVTEGVEGIAKCPKCNFIAIVDPALPENLFHCPECRFKSCKLCGDEHHPNITCDQVEKREETDGRRAVEEAMTTALVRTCPRPFCRKKFLKSDGCNKMTCSCGCMICYVCRKEIPPSVAYKHFCQTCPHCQHESCKKCPLFADTSADDKTRIRSAAETVATKVENKVKVDVNAMLKDPPVAAPQRQNPPKGRARPPTPVRRQRQPVRGGGMPPPPGSPPAPGRPLMQQPPQQGGQFRGRGGSPRPRRGHAAVPQRGHGGGYNRNQWENNMNRRWDQFDQQRQAQPPQFQGRGGGWGYDPQFQDGRRFPRGGWHYDPQFQGGRWGYNPQFQDGRRFPPGYPGGRGDGRGYDDNSHGSGGWGGGGR